MTLDQSSLEYNLAYRPRQRNHLMDVHKAPVSNAAYWQSVGEKLAECDHDALHKAINQMATLREVQEKLHAEEREPFADRVLSMVTGLPGHSALQYGVCEEGGDQS